MNNGRTPSPNKTDANDVNVNRKVLVSAVISAVAGYLAVWLPWKFAGSQKNMIDGMQLSSLLYLVVVGWGCALAVPHRFWVAGLASISLFPVMSIVGVILDPTSHNLLGIELILYVFLTIPVFVGGTIGRLMRSMITHRRK